MIKKSNISLINCGRSELKKTALEELDSLVNINKQTLF